jgi:ATP-binding cassette subfamily F protein uup
MALVTLDRISIAYGSLPLLDNAALQIEEGERVCILGRNGTGKSTLLAILAGSLEPDSGSVYRQPSMRTALLNQDAALGDERPVFDAVADGLGDLGRLAAEYHHAAVRVSESTDPALLDRLGRLHQELEEKDGWRLEQRVETILSRLELPPDAIVDTLSGGWRRRVLLARALVAQPELLLLDEPTNHLDIGAIAWLEGFLAEYAGTVVAVTHDRELLQRLASRIVELDRGRLTSWECGYGEFLRRKEEWLANEALGRAKFDRRLEEEETWLRRGVKARRTRNEGRVRALMAMRAERAARRARTGTARLELQAADPSGRLVYEADHVSKSFRGKIVDIHSLPEVGPIMDTHQSAGPKGGCPQFVIRDFSIRIMRGDRIGLLGPNGGGKTTLLRLLLGELAPDSGSIRVGTNVQPAYYDQQREQLDPEKTVLETVGEGNEVVTINGRSRHINGYLRDFLFAPERARSPVKALSGGERNRLLLARLFTRPANVLVLDEPTNDLDLETLELLEARLVDFPGTILLVSHDRAFLENVVTSMLVFEPGGRVEEHIGGYAAWAERKAAAEAKEKRAPKPRASAPRGEEVERKPARRKLSYMEQREYDLLPGRIEELEAEQEGLDARISAPDFYLEAPDEIARVLERKEVLHQELLDAYTLWDSLDSRTR